jgi:hypothetical protein
MFEVMNEKKYFPKDWKLEEHLDNFYKSSHFVKFMQKAYDDFLPNDKVC